MSLDYRLNKVTAMADINTFQTVIAIKDRHRNTIAITTCGLDLLSLRQVFSIQIGYIVSITN